MAAPQHNVWLLQKKTLFEKVEGSLIKNVLLPEPVQSLWIPRGPDQEIKTG